MAGIAFETFGLLTERCYDTVCRLQVLDLASVCEFVDPGGSQAPCGVERLFSLLSQHVSRTRK